MSRIYSATYSNVPVYEFNVSPGNHVMRRRSDDWINATHILKVAEFDKPARTRILEREVQKGTHEKVQGGYGKYQGTWIPLPDGRALAEKNHVLEKLLPIFDFVPGDRSPPPAPKHATAASSKPKAARQPASRRVPVPRQSQVSDISYDDFSNAHDRDTPDNATMVSDSEGDMIPNSQHSMGSRKRKRGIEQPPAMTFEEQQHIMWSDELLDYFMLQNCSEPPPPPPEPHPCIDVNRPVDDKGHTPMHWAVAMGDVNVVRSLLRRGAEAHLQNASGETPLMRAVMFTNNFEHQTMEHIMAPLHATAGIKDWFGSSVFHHIAMSTCSKSKYNCARYYLETILAHLLEKYPPAEIARLLDQQDSNGDTAVLLAARNGARRCCRVLVHHGASTTSTNTKGETAEELIKGLNARRQDRYRHGSSSPVMAPADQSISSHMRTTSSVTAPGAKHGTTSRFLSEAASLLTSQLPTLISARAEALASALETQLADAEMQVQEGDRVLEARKADIEALAAKSAALAAEAGARDSAMDEREEAEVQALENELGELLRREQITELERRTKAEVGRLSKDAKAHPAGDSDTEKLALLRQLSTANTHRHSLINDIVSAASLAGGQATTPQQKTRTTRHDLYKRLISSALSIRPEEVESMLPEILSELEEEKGVGANGAGGGDTDLDGDLTMSSSGGVGAAPPMAKMYGTGVGVAGEPVGVIG